MYNKNIFTEIKKFFDIEPLVIIGRKDKILAVIAILFFSLFISYLALDRTFLTFISETDYLGGYIPEAKRLLNGQSLMLKFHPPFYSIILAGTNLVVQDWFTSGLLISFISSIVVLGFSFILFYSIGGKWAAWGSFIGLVTSSTYIAFSATASSDLFFMALAISSIAFAFYALDTNSIKYWMLSGLLLGCTFITRSNGITLLLLLLLPWLKPLTFRLRLANFLGTSILFLMPVTLWMYVANITDSPFMPQKNHITLAAIYYSGSYGDIYAQIHDKFNNLWDVLKFDPVKIMVHSIKNNLVRFPQLLFEPNKLLSFPLNLLAFPGMVFLLLKSKRFYISAFFLLVICYLLMISLNGSEHRYFLLLIPFLGASVGYCFKILNQETKRYGFNYILIIITSLLLIGGAARSYKTSYAALHSSDKELAEAVPKAKQVLPPNSFIMTRKPHLGFYTQSQTIRFPKVESLSALYTKIQHDIQSRPLFIYYGQIERLLRPKLSLLMFPAKSPEWLEVVSQGKNNNSWVLYRFNTL